MDNKSKTQNKNIISVKNSVWFPLIIYLAGTMGLAILSYYLGGTIVFTNALFVQGLLEPKIFTIIWPIMIILLSISIYLQYISKKTRPIKEIRENLVSFYIHYFIILFWPLAFFRLNSPIAGLVIIIIAVITGIYVVYRFFNSSIAAGILSLIYELWLMYIMYINFAVVLHI